MGNPSRSFHSRDSGFREGPRGSAQPAHDISQVQKTLRAIRNPWRNARRQWESAAASRTAVWPKEQKLRRTPSERLQWFPGRGFCNTALSPPAPSRLNSSFGSRRKPRHSDPASLCIARQHFSRLPLEAASFEAIPEEELRVAPRYSFEFLDSCDCKIYNLHLNFCRIKRCAPTPAEMIRSAGFSTTPACRGVLRRE